MTAAIMLFLVFLTASPCPDLQKGEPSKVLRTAGGEKCTLDDGPHVFWQDDSTAVVFYYWRGELESGTFTADDMLEFQGFAWDSSRTYRIPVAAPQRGSCRFRDVERFLAVSDIHGDFDHFREILLNSGVIDGEGRWTWGDGHLVIDGDVFDRGPQVTECLWLIYRLEQEAALQGGRVHFLLGNHELMVMRGDLRYVHERYLDGIGGSSGLHYDDLFGPDTELGRWLRTKPSVVIIDGTLFVHGGIAPESVTGLLEMEEMNELAWSGLDFSTVRLKYETDVRTLYGSLGPFWYRGYHYAMDDLYHEAFQDEIEQILDFYGADRMVVGHSERDSLTVLYDGRVFAIDVPVDELDGQQALLWDNGSLYRIDADGSRNTI